MQTKDLLAITKDHGAPIYVYDGNQIVEQYTKLETAFKQIENLKIRFAMKALPNISILKLLRKLGSGLDAVSIQEVRLGLHAGFDPKSIIYTPNGVSFEELEKVAKLGIQINIDNLETLEKFGNQYPEIPVCIRINPHISAGGNEKIQVGKIDSKFGISVHQLPHIITIMENTKMCINGLHMHPGSDILDLDVFMKTSDILFQNASLFKDLTFLDLGGGFKVPYKINDKQTDLKNLGEKLAKKFNKLCKELNKELTLAFQPGKFLVSQSGYFLTKVNVVKQTTSKVFACVDSGLNHLIRPMFYDAYHQISNISRPDGEKRFYNVVGYICETDTFATDRKIADIQQGDILCFKNAGAYCFSMASNYNSRFRPAEVLWYNNKAHLIRERENFDDILRHQIEVDVFNETKDKKPSKVKA